MVFDVDRVEHDSSLDSLVLSHRNNESYDQFSRPVVGYRKARLSVPKSCPDRTGFSFPAYHQRSVIPLGCIRPKEGSGFDDFGTEGKRLKLPLRVKEIEMNVGTHPAQLQKTISEGEKHKAWLHTESRSIDLTRNLSLKKREGKSLLPPPESKPEEQTELNLEVKKSLCVRCGKNEQYYMLDICEPCVSEIAGI